MIDPKDARAFNNRGFAYRNKGQFDAAIADYNQALTINPNYALALYNRGIAYYDKRDFERATRDMNQAIKINPNFSTAVHDRGITYYDQHAFDRAAAAADTAAKSKPTYAMGFNVNGSAYENRREGDRIIQDAGAPIRNNQYNAYAYSPDTFPPASPPVIEPQSVAVPAAPVKSAAAKMPITTSVVPPQADDIPLPVSRPKHLPRLQRPRRG